MSNEVPRLAIFGGGDHGSRHVHETLQLGPAQAVIDTIVEEDPERIAALRDAHGEQLVGVHFRPDWEEALRERGDHLDAVINCLPDQHHLPVTKAVLRIRRHLLGEKPLATTMEEYEQLERLYAEAEAESLVFLPCNPREAAGPWKWLMEFVRNRKLLADHFGELGGVAIGDLGPMLSLRALSHYAAPSDSKAGSHTSAAADKLNHSITTLCRLTDVDSFDSAFLQQNTQTKFLASLVTTNGVSLIAQGIREGIRHKDRKENMYHEEAQVLFPNGALMLDASAATITLRYGERSITDKGDHYRKSSRANIRAMTAHFLARIGGRETNRFGSPEYVRHTALLSTVAALALEQAGQNVIPIARTMNGRS